MHVEMPIESWNFHLSLYKLVTVVYLASHCPTRFLILHNTFVHLSDTLINKISLKKVTLNSQLTHWWM